MKSGLNWLNQHYQPASILVGVTTVVITAILASCEYRNENALKKVERSLEFANQYRSGSILKAREELQISFDQLIDKKKREKLSHFETGKLINDSLKKGRNKINYGSLIELFSAAHNCVELGACDRDTLDKLLSYNACHLLLRYYWKVKEDNENDKEYTEGLIYFAGKDGEGNCKL